MTALNQGEDPPPNAPGDRLELLDGDDDERTKPDLTVERSKRTTLTPAEANAALVRSALEQSAQATEALNKLLGTLATKDDVAAIKGELTEIRGGIALAIAGNEDTHQALVSLRADLRTWLFGSADPKPSDPPPRSIAGDLGLALEQSDSALAAIGKFTTRFEGMERRQLEIKRVANGTWAQVTSGKLDASERDAIDAIVVQDSAAGR